MKEIPILFSTPMVQAILEGRKTKTRRIISVHDLQENPDRFKLIGDSRDHEVLRPAIKYDDRLWFDWELKNSNAYTWVERCKWKPGDILWVRECFQGLDYPDGTDSKFRFKADQPEGYQTKWKPSIHMPKAAARIWLEVTDIRVERLHDITWQDIEAEGVVVPPNEPFSPMHGELWERLWVSINGQESYVANPWVWVISFEVISTTGKYNSKKQPGLETLVL